MVRFGGNGSWQMPDGKPYREPMFNLPKPIMVLGGIMILLQALRSFVLSEEQQVDVLLGFAFIPARYGQTALSAYDFPGGIFGDLWTFVTYAFLHGSWMHLVLNLVWMAAFATVILRRVGTARFAGFFIVTAAAGAAVHYLVHSGSMTPLVGVSAVLSGAMAAAARFAFEPGQMGGLGSALQGTHRMPCLTLAQLKDNKQAMTFLGIWLALNLIFGLTAIGGGGASIAWEAHLGGFLAGLLLFPYFDSVPRRPSKPSGRSSGPKKPDHPHIRVIK